MPYILKATPLENFKARLVFSDRTKKVVDLKPYLKGRLFGCLKNPKKFKELRVSEGGVLEWPNGADICPDLLYHGGTPPWAGYQG